MYMCKILHIQLRVCKCIAYVHVFWVAKAKLRMPYFKSFHRKGTQPKTRTLRSAGKCICLKSFLFRILLGEESSQKQGYGRDCDPGRYSHGILLKMHEMLQGCWFPFMVCWFICSFRPIFSMGSCLHKGVLLGIRAYWNHPPKKRRRF